jgi:hypothetical protein
MSRLVAGHLDLIPAQIGLLPLALNLLRVDSPPVCGWCFLRTLPIVFVVGSALALAIPRAAAAHTGANVLVVIKHDTQIEQPIVFLHREPAGTGSNPVHRLTKNVPIRLSGTGGRSRTNANVDSELTLLYRAAVSGTDGVFVFHKRAAKADLIRIRRRPN